MGYLDTMSWEKIKKELQDEVEKAVGAIMNGASAVQKRAEALTVEGKRQYNLLSTKLKIHDAMRDLGAKVYKMMSGARVRNPALDAEVKAIAAHIRSLEAELAKLEGKAGAALAHAAHRTKAAAKAKAPRKAPAAPRARAPRKAKTKSAL